MADRTPPTFLSKAGKWLSRDGTLFKTAKKAAQTIAPTALPGTRLLTDPVLAKPRNAVAKLAKEIVQGTARSGGSVGLTLAKTPELRADTKSLPDRAQRAIFGDAPLKSIPQRVKDATPKSDELLSKYLGTKPGSKAAGPLAAAAVLGTTGLDFTGGGKKKAAEKVAKVAPKVLERGFVSSVKEAFPEVKKVAGQYIPRDTDELVIKAKNLIRDDLRTAEKFAVNHTDDKSIATGAELIKHYSEAAAKAGDEATKTALFDKAADLANSMATRLTESGRTVQAASLLGRLTPEGQLRFAAREIQKYNQAVESSRGGLLGLRKRVPELTGEQAANIASEMRQIQDMPDGIEKAMRFKALQDKISDLVPSSLYQKVVSVWKAGLLTGIKTSGLNIFSNLSHATMEVAKDIPAVAVDSVASLFTGKRSIGVTVGKTGSGVKEGFGKGWRYLRTGFDERNMAAKLDYKRVNFGSGPIAKSLQKYEETVFKIIGAQDQPFYYGAKARSLADQAAIQAKNAKLKGAEAKKYAQHLIENPTDEMVRYAVLDAETSVFQQTTKLGQIARGIQNLPGGELVVPFGKTPSAVAMQVINYSPVGIVKTIIQNIGKGRFDQRLFSQGMGRAITGTAALAIGKELYDKGLVNLDRPTTEKERTLWEAEGRTANSIKIGDKWRTIQVLGPAGNLLLVGAHLTRAFKETGSPTAAMVQGAFGTAKSFTEQTFLSGMSQFIDALKDPQRFGEGYLAGMLGSSVPTLVSDVARANDPSERRTEGISDRFKSRVPGLRKTLEPQVDIVGRERARAGNPAETMLDASRPSNDVSNDVVRELRRLTDTGLKVSPTKLGDREGFKGLTPEQNTELWKRAGEITNTKLSALIQDERYQKLPDEKKAEVVEDFVDKSKLIARVEVVLQQTEGLEGQELKNRLSELKTGGVMNSEVYARFLELR